jgi:DNA-binding cell septation regulator SpoVG
MEIEVIRLLQLDKETALKAFADVEVIEGSCRFTISGVKVFHTRTIKGDFITMPPLPPKERTKPNGYPAKWFDIIALDKETFSKGEVAVIAAYRR